MKIRQTIKEELLRYLFEEQNEIPDLSDYIGNPPTLRVPYPVPIQTALNSVKNQLIKLEEYQRDVNRIILAYPQFSFAFLRPQSKYWIKREGENPFPNYLDFVEEYKKGINNIKTGDKLGSYVVVPTSGFFYKDGIVYFDLLEYIELFELPKDHQSIMDDFHEILTNSNSKNQLGPKIIGIIQKYVQWYKEFYDPDELEDSEEEEEEEQPEPEPEPPPPALASSPKPAEKKATPQPSKKPAAAASASAGFKVGQTVAYRKDRSLGCFRITAVSGNKITIIGKQGSPKEVDASAYESVRCK
jgi:hypothetical protein